VIRICLLCVLVGCISAEFTAPTDASSDNEGGASDGGFPPDSGSNDSGADAGVERDDAGVDASSCSHEMCETLCVDTSTHADHCGGCGRACAVDEICAEGVCICDGVSCATRPVKIAGGDSLNCIVDNHADVWCWGGASPNYLPETEPASCSRGPCHLTPVRLAVPEDVAEVRVGIRSGCARTVSGRVYCFGAWAGLEGSGAPPVEPSVIADRRFDALGSAVFAFCGVSGGQVFCWGSNTYGTLGIGVSTGGHRVVPVAVAMPDGFAEASVLGSGVGRHMCASDEAGHIACWGSAAFGQTGDLPEETCNGARCNTRAVLVGRGEAFDVEEIALAAQSSCIRDSAGGISCWGRGDRGELGSDDIVEDCVGADLRADCRLAPTAVDGETPRFARVATNGGAFCAADIAGRGYCWGPWNSGSLGNGATEGEFFLPSRIELPDIASLEATSGRCAIDRDSRVWCWGLGASGELGGDEGDDVCSGNGCELSPRRVVFPW